MNSIILSIIWNKLGNKKFQIYSMVSIFLFYVSVNIYFYFKENGEMTTEILFLNILVSIGIGTVVSGVILFVWHNLNSKRNDFINQYEILNFDNFLRIYIMYYIIVIPLEIISYV